MQRNFSAPQPKADRAAPRHKVFEPTRMLAGGCEGRVHLINVSLSGALVHGGTGLALGVTVQLQLGAAWHAARVRWLDGARFGVSFTRPLSQAELDAVLAGH